MVTKTMTLTLDDLTPKQLRIMSRIPADGAKISAGRLYDVVQRVGWSYGPHGFTTTLAGLRKLGYIKWVDGMVWRADERYF